MRRIRVGLIAAVVALGAASWSAAPAAAGTAAPAVSYYLSLGDSLAQGVQPEPEPNGPNTPTKQGYPDQLYPTLRAANPTLQLQKVGCPGETTTTMLRGGGPCAAAYTTGSQLGDAVQFLRAHHGHIADLTINIGSNDILSCVQPDGSIDTACTLGEIQTARSNLNTILATLHPYIDGHGVKAAGMTYYDPLLAAWTQPPTGRPIGDPHRPAQRRRSGQLPAPRVPGRARRGRVPNQQLQHRARVIGAGQRRPDLPVHLDVHLDPTEHPPQRVRLPADRHHLREHPRLNDHVCRWSR